MITVANISRQFVILVAAVMVASVGLIADVSVVSEAFMVRTSLFFIITAATMYAHEMCGGSRAITVTPIVLFVHCLWFLLQWDVHILVRQVLMVMIMFTEDHRHLYDLVVVDHFDVQGSVDYVLFTEMIVTWLLAMSLQKPIVKGDVNIV